MTTATKTRRRTVAISGLSVAGTLAPGLPVIHALQSAAEFTAEWRVVGLSYNPLDPPNYDPGLVDKTYLLPYPSFGAERLFDRLSHIHRQERLDAVMPTLDSELPLFLQLASRLRELGIQLLLPSEAAFKLRSKSELPRVSDLTGIRVPRSLVAKSLDEAIKQAQKLPLPLVVKGNLHGATVVHSLDQVVPAAIDHANRWGYPVVLQEFIPGTEFDVVALANAKHELIGAVPMKKLQLDDRGKAWGALTIDDPALCREAERAVRGLRWVGALELELVRHRDSGEHYLIEINPRFPAWVHLAVAAGQNLPWAMLQLTMGETVPRFAGYQVGVLQLRRAVDETASLATYEALVSRGEANPGQPEPGSIQTRFASLPAPAADESDSPQRSEKASESDPADKSSDAEAAGKPTASAPREWGNIQGEGASETYQRPSIVRHHAGIASRFTNADGAGHRVIADIDGVAVAELVKRYGSPLFVFSERTLRSRCASLRQIFTSRYPKVRFAWSYKTNYIDALCGILHQEGWEAEVVSDLEYAMARRLGISGPRIICNGAYKPLAWLEQAAEEGALIQIDHFDELDQLEAVARRRGLKLPVGLRVNLRTEALGGASWERFGFNLENGEVLDAILRIIASDSLRLVGLHCHLGTFINDPKAYKQSAASLLELFGAAEQLCGYRLSILNIGGGFPSSNVLGGSAETDGKGPDMVPFAEAVIDEIRSVRGNNPANLPTLVLESGRHLIDDAGSLITTVVGTRRLSSGERGVVLDGGLNVLYTAHWYRHRFTPAQPVAGPIEETTLHGPLCMNIDVLRTGLALPPLNPGHQVVIQPVGAYNVTQWMQFSQRRPALVLVGQNGQVDVIRRAETIDDVKGPESLPARYAAIPTLR